ncbi:hypothetical protein [Niallia sp. NCCP-28]|uniref:hypothetical protein n=1 Tax=Niallia sp. NCCP-28 TaxID=2934712 RepID=UPI00207E00BC|nr:hypothetical protein [Niallia sp. NCCP-28]GKU82654.1 hypothetical protein NCCP28_20500 [Niallia sp. NCCP-28]
MIKFSTCLSLGIPLVLILLHLSYFLAIFEMVPFVLLLIFSPLVFICVDVSYRKKGNILAKLGMAVNVILFLVPVGFIMAGWLLFAA